MRGPVEPTTSSRVVRATRLFEGAILRHYGSPGAVVPTAGVEDTFERLRAQAYRPHILDMFEPQDYPENFEFPGGPPIPPADATGYTPAFQMGVGFERVLDPLDVPSERISSQLSASPGRIVGDGKAGYLVGHGANNSFILSNRLLKAGQPVSWLATAGGASSMAGGAEQPARTSALAASKALLAVCI